MSKTDGGKGAAASTKTKGEGDGGASAPGKAARAAPATLGAGQMSRDWSKTLFLPETAFPMRAGLPRPSRSCSQRWAITSTTAARRHAQGAPLFVLHDGPPYANGPIHIGHALNKILKDFVVRSRSLLGLRCRNYVPGWDCHGLPIEWKIEEEFRAKGRNKDEVPINEFRAECRDFAAHWIDVQREEFQRLGVLGDWDASATRPWTSQRGGDRRASS